jgi:hypothetical protein
LNDKIKDTTSSFAEQGTAAHEYSELLLRFDLTDDVLEAENLSMAISQFRIANKHYDQEMEDCIRDYVTFVLAKLYDAKQRSADAVIALESKLDYSLWTAPESTGTGDVVIIADGLMSVTDLKWGKGRAVSAVNNSQLRLYALGALNEYGWEYDIDRVRMTIYQPRKDNISEEELSVGELLDWAETVVQPAAELAIKGEGEFKSGSHCKWCKVKATCRARAEENMKAVEHEFRDPALLSGEEIGQILFLAEQLAAWAKDIKEYAFEQAKAGHAIPQWKLIAGKSNRKITDPEELAKRLLAAEYTEDQFTEKKFVGITALDKLVGKAKLAKLAGELIIKPPGAPSLMPESDPRPAINSVEQDFADVDLGGDEGE